MNILVDTHILIWVVGNEDGKISSERLRLLKDPGNRVCVCQISIMELAIKKALGKLPELVASIAEITQTWLDNGFEVLPLKNEHIIYYEQVPLLIEHRDPLRPFYSCHCLVRRNGRNDG